MTGDALTHRERLMRAISLQEPDRLPTDLGSHRDSSIVLAGYENLKKHLGIESETKIASKMTQVAMMDGRILDMLGIVTQGVYPGAPHRSSARTLCRTAGGWIAGVWNGISGRGYTAMS